MPIRTGLSTIVTIYSRIKMEKNFNESPSQRIKRDKISVKKKRDFRSFVSRGKVRGGQRRKSFAKSKQNDSSSLAVLLAAGICDQMAALPPPASSPWSVPQVAISQKRQPSKSAKSGRSKRRRPNWDCPVHQQPAQPTEAKNKAKKAVFLSTLRDFQVCNDCLR